jgi:hypothetical protein
MNMPRTAAAAPTAPAVTALRPPDGLVSLCWDVLHESPLNPRRHRDAERLRELMASIERYGVQQNLVVRPLKHRPGDYEVVAGSRRREAVEALVSEGRLAPDFSLPVRIVEVSDVELVERALSENIQREELTPLEQADGFACHDKRGELAALWSWVELKDGGWVNPWEWERDQPPAAAGAIIHLRDDLRVEIHTGLARRQAETPPVESGAQAGERAPPAPLSRTHLVWAQQEKTRRLRAAIAAHPRAAAVLMLLDLLDVPLEDRIANLPELPAAPAERLCALLRLDQGALADLFAWLVALRWQAGESGDSPLIVALAEALDIVEPAGFTLSADYLERLPREQVLRVAHELGLAKRVVGLASGALIDAILLDEDRAADWSPPELRFASPAELAAALAAPGAPQAAAQ